MARLDPEREKELRVLVVRLPSPTPGARAWSAAEADKVHKGLADAFDEIDYLRGQVENETAYASELRRQLNARLNTMGVTKVG